MAERFRDLVRPALIDVGARSTRSGGAEASLALADSLSSFSRVAGGVATTLSAQRGTQEGAQAGTTGVPDFKSGLRSLTAYGEAYNNSALRSYAIRVETDMVEQAARLEVEAGTNPEAFRDAMAERRKAILGEAPVEARSLIGEVYTQRMAEGLSRIQVKLATEIREQDKILGVEQANQFVENISFMRAQDTLEMYERARQEEMKLDLLLNSMEADGTMSEIEVDTLRKDMTRQTIVETAKAKFDKELLSPVGDPIQFIEDLKEINKTADVLPPEEEDALVSELFGMLRERNSLRDARASAEDAAVEARFKVGDREMTTAVLARKATDRDLIEAMDDEKLTSARGLTLSNAIASRASAPPKSDPRTLTMYEINLLSKTEDEILLEDKLSWDDRGALVLERRDEAAGWKGSQRAREAVDRIKGALDILGDVPLRRLSEEELTALTRGKRQFYEEIDALPPKEREAAMLEVADKVVADIERVDDEIELAKAREKLAELKNKNIEDFDQYDENTYNSSIARLENRISLLEARVK